MAGRRGGVRPEPGERGLATADPALVAELAVGAWRSAVDLARTLPLERPSRLPGWRVHDVLAHLGAWPENPTFSTLLDDARHGRRHEPDDVDARNTLVVAAHHDASRSELVAALAEAADRVGGYLGSAEATTLGATVTQSRLGPLPLTCVVAASGYELAVHALDVLPDRRPDATLLDAGIAALVDVTAALAARREADAEFAVITAQGAWAAAVRGADWTTVRLAPGITGGEYGGPALEGAAADVLDASAGRLAPVPLVLSRRIRVHDLTGLIGLLPALEGVAGIPGGIAVRAAAGVLGRAGGLLGGLRRGRD